MWCYSWRWSTGSSVSNNKTLYKYIWLLLLCVTWLCLLVMNWSQSDHTWLISVIMTCDVTVGGGQLGHPCLPGDSCADSNAVCVLGVCLCHDNFFEKNTRCCELLSKYWKSCQCNTKCYKLLSINQSINQSIIDISCILMDHTCMRIDEMIHINDVFCSSSRSIGHALSAVNVWTSTSLYWCSYLLSSRQLLCLPRRRLPPRCSVR